MPAHARCCARQPQPSPTGGDNQHCRVRELPPPLPAVPLPHSHHGHRPCTLHPPRYKRAPEPPDAQPRKVSCPAPIRRRRNDALRGSETAERSAIQLRTAGSFTAVSRGFGSNCQSLLYISGRLDSLLRYHAMCDQEVTNAAVSVWMISREHCRKGVAVNEIHFEQNVAQQRHLDREDVRCHPVAPHKPHRGSNLALPHDVPARLLRQQRGHGLTRFFRDRACCRHHQPPAGIDAKGHNPPPHTEIDRQHPGCVRYLLRTRVRPWPSRLKGDRFGDGLLVQQAFRDQNAAEWRTTVALQVQSAGELCIVDGTPRQKQFTKSLTLARENCTRRE